MLTDDVTLRRHHRAGSERQVAIQKFAERPLANKANAGRILLAGVRQRQFTGDTTDIGFLQLAQRKQRARQLGLIESMQEITLVFAGVDGLE